MSLADKKCSVLTVEISDRLIRHRACMLRDTAYSIVREEMDEDFERCCEEIQESRKERGMDFDTEGFKTYLCNQQCTTQFFVISSLLQGCSSSKYAPSYYHVMPKQNSVAGSKGTDPKCSDKLKVPAEPVGFSTPHSKGKLYFIHTFLEKVLMLLLPCVFLGLSRFL